MLMVGAAGRNAGKTQFACSLIARLARERPVVGIKVTTIRERGGACPRGGRGCGVCSSLEDDYCLTEETGAMPEKDTSRLLAAGAEQVFWLRVLKEHLGEGLAALLDRVGPGAATVCESNGLRHVAEPDLFLMVKERGAEGIKESAKAVMEYADRVVLSDGATFDISLDEIGFSDGRWAMRRDATAIVLAGGASSRMGRDKSMLAVHGKPMIQLIVEQLRPHFREILVSSNDVDRYAFLGEPVVADDAPGRGQLAGIASSLDASRHDLAFVVACDMPQIDLDLVQRMFREADGYDGVVPLAGGAMPEPLFAVYRKSMAAAAREALASGRRRVSEMFAERRMNFIALEGSEPPRNLNTMADYAQFQQEHNDTV